MKVKPPWNKNNSIKNEKWVMCKMKKLRLCLIVSLLIVQQWLAHQLYMVFPSICSTYEFNYQFQCNFFYIYFISYSGWSVCICLKGANENEINFLPYSSNKKCKSFPILSIQWTAEERNGNINNPFLHYFVYIFDYIFFWGYIKTLRNQIWYFCDECTWTLRGL